MEYCCESIKHLLHPNNEDVNLAFGEDQKWHLSGEVLIGPPVFYCPFCGSVLTFTPKLFSNNEPE